MAAAVTVLVLGVAGLGVSLAGMARQLLPRQFTASQQRQIADWEVGSRWRTSRNGCAAMLRATYVDGTGSYVVTVGVGVMPGSAQAAAADRELPPVSRDPGVHAVRFAGTPAAWFTNSRRQLSASVAAGTYVFFYTIGYADDRPRVPVAADSYADAEMTSLGRGVARAVDLALTLPVPAPHCPGTAGC